MNIGALQEAVGETVELLRALASEKRLRILCLLSQKERSVGELCALLALAQANASQQLALLRRSGLVMARRDGQAIYYSLASEEGRLVLEALCAVYGRRRSWSDARRRRDVLRD